MNTILQGSTAFRVTGRGYLAADHISPAPGLNPVITISKNGGSFADPAIGASEMIEIDSTAWYYFELGAGDVDTLGPLIIKATHAGMDDIEVVFQVVTDTVAMIGGIGTSGGAAINVDSSTCNVDGGITGVTSGTTFKGTQTALTCAATSVLDGNKHVITGSDTGNTIFDIVYQFLTGGGTSPVGMTFTGLLNSGDDTCIVSAWNHVGGTWETIGTIAGQVSTTTNIVKNLVLYARHAGTSAAELGKVYLRFNCTGTTPVLRVDQIYVTYAVTSRSVGYTEGAVWIDTNSTNTGTELYVNGTADKPVSTIADAFTIAAAVGLRRIRVINGSSITLPATPSLSNYTFVGKSWNLALASRAITGCYFEGANVTGICSGDGFNLTNCVVGTCTLSSCTLNDCSLAGTITLVAGKDYNFHNCADGLPAGSSLPTITFKGTDNVGLRNWHGGVNLVDMSATDAIKIDGQGRVVLDDSCVDGDIVIRGLFTFTDNAGSSFTGDITEDARFNVHNIVDGNVISINDVLQTANDNGADLNTLVTESADIALIKIQTDKIANFFTLITTVVDNNPFSDEYPSQELTPYFRLTTGVATKDVYIGDYVSIYVPAVGGIGSPAVVTRRITGYGGVDGTSYGNKMYVVQIDEPFGIAFANGTPVVIFAGIVNLTVPDAAGTAATLHAVTDGLINTAQADLDLLTGTDGCTLSSASVDAIWDEVLTGATHNIQNSAGKKLRQIPDLLVDSGAVASGSTTNTIVLAAADSSAVNGVYVPSQISVLTGTGAGQTRLIIGYSVVGTVHTAVIDRNWKTIPAAGDTFIIVGHPGRDEIQEGLAVAASTDTITLSTSAETFVDAYKNLTILICSGTGTGQVRRINSYTGSTRVATINRAWTVLPDTTSGYFILPMTGVPPSDITTLITSNDSIVGIKAKTDVLEFNSDGEILADTSDLALESSVQGVKTQTDLLRFTGNDVKATLDGEEVTTDSASRIASKADVSKLDLAISVLQTNLQGTSGDTLKTISDQIDTIVPGTANNIQHNSTTIVRK